MLALLQVSLQLLKWLWSRAWKAALLALGERILVAGHLVELILVVVVEELVLTSQTCGMIPDSGG